jgi:prefoldin subunit 5
MTENILVDPNTADEKDLKQIPGVGPTMAQRIVTAPPFVSLDDLQRVGGIGPKFLKQAGPLVALSPVEPVDADTVEEEAVASESKSPVDTEPQPTPEDTTHLETEESLGKDEIPVEAGNHATAEDESPADSDDETIPEVESPPEDETILPEKEPALVTRTQAIWIAFGSGLLALILAVALILSILVGVNGGLQFAAPAQVAEISLQVDGLSTQSDLLRQDMEGLRTRLDNLEGLSGRVDNVETAAEQLQTDMEAIDAQLEGFSQQIDGLNTHIDDLGTQVETLKDQNTRFQGFFDGLRDLLDGLFQSEETK